MKLIDKGDYYFIENLEPSVKYSEDGSLEWIHYSPYMPKFLFDGDETGSIHIKNKV